MKKTIGLLLLALPITGICQQQHYKISGLLAGLKSKAKAYLVYKRGNDFTTDSCIIKSGRFSFTGVCAEPQLATLLLGHQGKFDPSGETDTQSVYLENGIIKVEGKDSLNKARIWGTPLNADNQEKIRLSKASKNKGYAATAQLMADFVKGHPASLVSLDWMLDFGGRNRGVIASYPALSPSLKQTKAGQELAQAIDAFLSVQEGKPAPDFALPDPQGKVLKLSDFRGKYVLLDFWSSWCKPCRALQPLLKSVYNALNPTGNFVILAVSVDKDKMAWMKAIKEDDVPWLQVADIGAVTNKAAALYDVNIIPRQFLIGPDGTILPQAKLNKLIQDKVLPLDQPAQQKVSIGRLSDLNQKEMLAAMKRENLAVDGFTEEFQKLDSILETDIGEVALGMELDKLDLKQDSAVMYNLLVYKGSSLVAEKHRMRQAFIAAHPDSFVSLDQLSKLEHMYSADSYALAYEGLSDRLKNTIIGQGVKERIGKLKLTPTGMKAPDFTRKNQYGKTVKLSDYRGKLVLLDFWGSWCVACRLTHPHLKELYERYKAKGLEIVAVSNEKNKDLEKGKQAWLAAIKKDDANWVHVLNNEGSGAPDIVKAYAITSFPTKLLLDKNGKILMRSAGGLNEEMDVLIKKLLDHEAL